MISYINPIVELLPNPAGVDKAIQSIQVALSSLGWLEKIFGRATVQRRKAEGDEKRDVIYPEVYNQREPMPLMINDNLASYCFFHASDPVTFVDYSFSDLEARATQPVDIIVWVNLSKIDPAKNYNFIEELRQEMIIKLGLSPGYVLKRSFMHWDRVFAPYTITDTFRNYLKPPYAAFRISGELSYNYSNC